MNRAVADPPGASSIACGSGVYQLFGTSSQTEIFPGCPLWFSRRTQTSCAVSPADARSSRNGGPISTVSAGARLTGSMFTAAESGRAGARPRTGISSTTVIRPALSSARARSAG